MDKQTVVLIDNHGLSFYTSYLACGLSRYNKISLLGISEEDYKVTGASEEKDITFHDIGKKLPKKNSVFSIIFVRQFIWFYILLTILLKTKYDIVHIQGHLPTFFLFIPYLKLKRKRICWTLHDVNLRPSSKGIRGKLELLYVNTVVQPSLIRRNANKIIVHGMSLKRQLVARGVKESKIVVVPIFDYRYLLKFNGDGSRKNLVSESDHKSEALDDGYILIFGRIKPYKGIDVFIDALKIVRKQLPNSKKFRVLIAGRGDVSYFEHLLTKEDLEYIEIRNEFIPNHKLPELFDKSRFVVLPYTDASQSAVTSLAYTFSKPVVASGAGSIGEYVDHNQTGLIFEPGNTEQLANYIIYLLENPNKCIEMGKRAHQKVLEEMSLEKCSEIISNSYNQD